MVFDKPAFGEYAFFCHLFPSFPPWWCCIFIALAFFSMRTDRVHYADLNVEWAVHSKTSKWCSNCHHKHKCCFCVCFFLVFLSFRSKMYLKSFNFGSVKCHWIPFCRLKTRSFFLYWTKKAPFKLRSMYAIYFHSMKELC